MQTLRFACLVGFLAIASSLGAQQAPQLTPDGAVRVSGGVMVGQVVKRVWPASSPCDPYPSGVVVMRAIIGTDGKVQQLTLLYGSPGPYGAAVMEAVRQWEYKPYLLNGNPVKVDTTVTVEMQRNSNGCGSSH